MKALDRAAACLRRAKTETDPEIKAGLLDLAKLWISLANGQALLMPASERDAERLRIEELEARAFNRRLH